MRPDLETESLIPSTLDPKLLERLRHLPDAAPLPYEFAEFSRRHSRRRAQQAQRPWRLAAAAVAVVIAGWVIRHGLGPVLSVVSPLADVPVPLQGVAATAPQMQPPMLAHWPVLLPTANAESWLSEHPRQAIVRVPSQMAVTELEDQIATMDDQLNAVQLSQSQAQQVAALQRDRAQLVESLAQVRYAQNLMAGLP
jgi:hypothetical protein